MKHLILSLAILASLSLLSCNSTKKLYEAKEYDQVIMKNAPKLCSGRINPDEVRWVASAYHEANQADHERIQQLKASGQPDVWPEIHERYKSMNGREKVLSCLPKELKKSINYQTLNLDEELELSKNKAESYLSAKIKQLLSTGEPADIAEAKKLTHTLMNVDPESELINEYRMMAMLRQTAQLDADFEYDDYRRPLPEGLDEAIMHFDETELSRFPMGKGDIVQNAQMIVELTDFIVTPDRDETVTFKESANGLTANVTDHNLSKSATLRANVKFFFKDPESVTGETRNVIVIRDLKATSLFKYNYTTIEGAQEACSSQTLERLSQKPLPFPTDVSLLRDAALKLNDLIAGQLSK